MFRRALPRLLPLLLTQVPAIAVEPGTFRARGFAYGPFRPGQSPLTGVLPTPEEIRRDLAILRTATESIRTYSSLGALEVIPRLAAKRGLAVLAGAWIGPDAAANQAEIEAVKQVARARRAKAVAIGSEALLRGDATEGQLVRYVEAVRAEVGAFVAVGVAEPWHIWVEHPALANAVDMLLVHVHPYWEGKSIGEAVGYVVQRYEELRARYPCKPIVIAETGWPSAGETQGSAVPSPANQEQFLRDWIAASNEKGIPYFLFEACDERWKIDATGFQVEGNWGLFDALRQRKPSAENALDNPPPTIAFQRTAKCGSGNADELGKLAGRVFGPFDPSSQRVVLYRSGTLWNIDPITSTPFARIRGNGRFSRLTRLGCEYAALLVPSDMPIPPVLGVLPPVGPGVSAVARVPCLENSTFLFAKTKFRREWLSSPPGGCCP